MVTEFFSQHSGELLRLIGEHLLLVSVATGAASAVGIPIGIGLSRYPTLSRPVLGFANMLQTIPSLALFGFLIPLLGHYGIGRVPAIIALFLYSLLPILRNTFTGIRNVDQSLREVGLGMGMTEWQLLTLVELPLATPVILAGIRVATVISVGTATIAAAIGAGGLGMYIFRGLRTSDNALLLAGAVPAALMAIFADAALGWLERSLGVWRTQVSKKRRGKAVLAIATLVGLSFAAVGFCEARYHPDQVTLGSKDFTEQIVVSELLAQMIESGTNLKVERRWELAGDLCHRALLVGEIDAYVEYTGTAFMTILKQPKQNNANEVYQQVKDAYASRFGLEWLPPLGYNNTYAILVRGEDARRLHLKTISDAVRYSLGWRVGCGPDFMVREDGYAGFVAAYGLRFTKPPKEVDLSFTYRALASGQVDLIAGDATAALIDKLDLYQLEDDLHYFPPYQAAAVFRKDSLTRHPEIVTALEPLFGRLTETDMRKLNNAVDNEHRDVREVVHKFLAEKNYGAAHAAER